MTKRKDRRRELLKQDEFLSSMERAVRYAQANPRKVGMWVFTVVVVLSLIAGGLKYTQITKDKNAEALYQAERTYLRPLDDAAFDTKYETEKEKNEAALKSLDTYVSKASGNDRAQGLIYKASCQMELGKMDEAEATYSELAKESGSYGAIGQIGLGDIYFGKKDYDKALGSYKKVLSNRDKALFDDFVKLRISVLYKEKGDLENAELELESLVQKYDSLEDAEKPPLYQDAKTLLEEIKGDGEES